MEIMSQDISKLAEALSKFQGALQGVSKTKQVSSGTYSYTYADLAEIWDAIREPLRENGLSVSQVYVDENNYMKLITVLMHSSGQWIRSSLLIVCAGLKIQQIGSLQTYNRRYALSAILGISTEDDDDAHAVDESSKREGSKESPKRNKTPATSSEEPTISSEDAQEIERLIDPQDSEYRKNLLEYFSTKSNKTLDDFFSLPRKHLAACMASVKRKHEQRNKAPEEEIPF